ncbi:MAG: D-alanine--D-alanine ligase [Nitrospirota bacterium]|nr:D-alanine--D-alanine ligase [Nitrospirota bacterium]MDH5773995.1 D-alanine--D-alanine ligase [Nitrospirota bacterium]
MKTTSLRVGVLMGGSSAEREISLKTGRSICESLQRRRYTVVPIDVDATLPQQLRAKNIGVAFIALHGMGGEDGTVQGLLEVMNIPYTGSGVSASAVCMDKGLTRVVLQAAGIPVPAGITLQAPFIPPRPAGHLGWPVVVKPCTEGSSIGVSIVKQASGWRRAVLKAYRHAQQAVVEKYIPGREVAVGVLGTKIFPGVEVIAPGGFYDFKAKYGKAATRYLCPAPLTARVERLLREYSLHAYQALGCRGATRVDFRIHPNGRPYVLELNTIPGMTARSLLPMAAAQQGMTYDDLVEAILQAALLNRGRVPRRTKTRKQGAT